MIVSGRQRGWCQGNFQFDVRPAVAIHIADPRHAALVSNRRDNVSWVKQEGFDFEIQHVDGRRSKDCELQLAVLGHDDGMHHEPSLEREFDVEANALGNGVFPDTGGILGIIAKAVSVVIYAVIAFGHCCEVGA